jgi:late competence protein required for DNA uptake (superfamily II DNA/RNA helicase)
MNLLLVLPTGSGKTLIYEYAVHETTDGNRIIVAPFVELVKQISNSMASVYSKFEIIPLFGGSQSSVHKNTSNSLVIGTPETILANLHKLTRVTLLIVDEAHLIDDQQRGSTIEKLVNIVLARNKNPWLIMSTATLSEESFVPLVARYRLKPFIIPTRMALNRKYFYYDKKSFQIVQKHEEKPRTLFRILDSLDGKVLIFVSLVKELTRLIHSYVNIHLNIKQSDTTFDRITDTMVKHRFTYYHGQMDDQEKSFNMELIRSGNINHIFCTSSLLTGIDIPNINNLVVYESVLYTPHKRVINVFEYIQLVGRVGRSGQSSSIHIIDFECNGILADYGSDKYWEDFDGTSNGLLPVEDIPKSKDRLFDVGIPSFRAGIVRSLMCSYYAYRIQGDSLIWIDAIIRELQNNGLVDTTLQPTALGSTVFRNNLSIEEYTLVSGFHQNVSDFGDKFRDYICVFVTATVVHFTTLTNHSILESISKPEYSTRLMSDGLSRFMDRVFPKVGTNLWNYSESVLKCGQSMSNDVVVLLRHKAKAFTRVISGLPECCSYIKYVTRVVDHLNAKIKKTPLNRTILEIFSHKDMVGFLSGRMDSPLEDILKEYTACGGDCFRLEILYRQIKRCFTYPVKSASPGGISRRS